MALALHKLLLFVLLCICASPCHGHGLHKCHHQESQALLLFKARLNDSRSTLVSWLNGTDCCTWHGISCDLQTNHVLTLNITPSWNSGVKSGSLDGGVISDSLCHLRSLTHLELWGNKLSGILPFCLGNLSRLQYLDLWANNLSGPIPPTICLLKDLTYLALSKNQLTGTLPFCLGYLSHLQYLGLGYNNLSGIIPPTICMLTNLTYLDLSNNKLNGSLPSCMGKRSSLNSPPLFGNLSHLRYLDLDNNNLSGPHRCRHQESQALLIFKARLNDSRSTLISWVNGTDCCMWHGISCDLYTNHVLTLNITMSMGGGVLSDSLCELRFLTHVELWENQFTGTLPLCLGNLFHLQYLDLWPNNLSGTIPPTIGSLSSLTVLYLAGNQLSGTIPTTICLLTNLTYLYLFGNQLTGSLPSCIGKLSSLKFLSLQSNQLSGSIPSSLGSLSSLNALDIRSNQFSGNVPDSLGNLSLLSSIDISSNKLSGTLPSSLARLSSLTYLHADSNGFNESIPSSTLPSSIQSLYLSLDNNQTISETFFHNLTKLDQLYLSNCVLNISTSWIPSFQLVTLALISCKTDGQIPLWISTQYSLEKLTLAKDNLVGEIPFWLWDISPSLVSINLTANYLQGYLFTNTSGWMQIMSLDLSKNALSGGIPSLWSPNMEILVLNDNLLVGKIPPTLGNLSYLVVLSLANNNLDGNIPLNLANCASLQILNLANNSLQGRIPHNFDKLSELSSLVLRKNKFEGLIPHSITNCSSLQVVDFGQNQFRGWIPNSIGNLSLLRVLVMRENNLIGNIPLEIGQLLQLQILDLSSNGISGFIPPNILFLKAMTITGQRDFVLSNDYLSKNNSYIEYQYEDELYITSKGIYQHYFYIHSTLTSIDFSNNQLSGEIPFDFGKLKGLMLLNLSMNNLMGFIPNSLGAMSQLESLDLSSNRIFGKIPMELDSLNYLGTLQLSNNNLSDSIPQGKKLNIFAKSSYTGNPNLWGCPLPKNCSWPQFASPPPTSSSKQEKSMEIPWYEIVVGLSWGASFGGTWSLLMVNRRWKDKYFQKIDVVLNFLLPWLNNWTL